MYSVFEDTGRAQQSQKMQKVLNQARMVIANETKKLNREHSRGSIKKS